MLSYVLKAGGCGLDKMAACRPVARYKKRPGLEAGKSQKQVKERSLLS